jgi:hypothetical protein
MKTVIRLGYDDYVPITSSGRIFTAWYIIICVCLGGAYIALAANYIQTQREQQDAIRNKNLLKQIQPVMARSKSISKYFSTLRKSLSRSAFNDNNDNNDNNSIIVDDIIDKDNEKKLERSTSKYGLTIKEEKSILDLSKNAFDKELRQHYIKIAIDILIISILIIIGMLVMMAFENWNPTDAFYFSVVTISSIGYYHYHYHYQLIYIIIIPLIIIIIVGMVIFYQQKMHQEYL